MGFVNLDTVKRAGIEIFGEGMIETFHNDDEALATVDNGVTIYYLGWTGTMDVKVVIFLFPKIKKIYWKGVLHQKIGEGQKDIAASGFVPCNSDSKDCLDIEVMENLNLGDLVGKPYGTQV
ncbi:hypothetical protein JHK85_022956 [Glycine max]|nr:hypothetical protein JHK85_022956 [Glycine max]